jgi:hypothetical protein
LPGNQHDWLAIAALGSKATSFVAWAYTNGQTSGTATFIAPGEGSYVARAFLNDGTTLLTQSGSFIIAVGTPSISTDLAIYAPGQPITVTYGGLPGNQKDWISIAAVGSADRDFVKYAYTNGNRAGTITFVGLTAVGSYVARALLNDTSTLIVESAPFTVAKPTITTDKTSYAQGDTITVTYAGLPGNQKDWIAIAADGSAATSFVAWVYTDGKSNGTATFIAPAFGSYVARAFLNDSHTLIVKSAPFMVATPHVSTDMALYPYAPGDTITVTYVGLPGNPTDWIAIAEEGSDTTSYVAWMYTNGQTSGTATFIAPAEGSYVARALLNDSTTLIAESDPFTVAPSTCGVLYPTGPEFLDLAGCGEVMAYAGSQSGIVAIATSNGRVQVIDVANRTVLTSISVSTRELSLSEDGKWLALYDDKLQNVTAAVPELKVFELPNNRPKYSKLSPSDYPNWHGFSLSSDGSRIGEFTVDPSCKSKISFAVTDIAFSTTYASGFYNSVSGCSNNNPSSLQNFVLSPDGTRLAWTVNDSSTRIFDGSDQIAGPLFPVIAIGWLTNESLLASVFGNCNGNRRFIEAQLLDPTGMRLSPPGSWALVPQCSSLDRGFDRLQVSQNGTRVFIPPNIWDSSGNLLWNGPSRESMMAGSHVLYWVFPPSPVAWWVLYDVEPSVLQ